MTSKLPADATFRHLVEGQTLSQVLQQIEDHKPRDWKSYNILAETPMSSLSALVMSQNNKAEILISELDKKLQNKGITDNIDMYAGEPIHEVYEILHDIHKVQRDIKAAMFWFANISQTLTEKHKLALNESSSSVHTIAELEAREKLMRAEIERMEAQSKVEKDETHKSLEDIKKDAMSLLVKKELEEIVARGLSRKTNNSSDPIDETKPKKPQQDPVEPTDGKPSVPIGCPDCGETLTHGEKLEDHECEETD